MSDPSNPSERGQQDTQIAPRPAEAATDVTFTAEGLVTRLGRYEIIKPLGEGGMAEVFLARHMGPGGFEKKVVIKRIRPELSDDDKFVRMFFREARNSARLSHPNVVSIFELAEEDNQYFIVMEYLEGLSWRHAAARRWYARRPLPISVVLKSIADAAFGLAHAHALTGSKGENTPLIHRDVSPDNLFLTLSGATKVLDFGIAKLDTGTNHGDLTQTGELKGKVPYMSPEQLMGDPLDGRSDIWSLGVTLYWLLTGKRPFKGRRQLQLIDQILTTAAPDPREDNPELPAAVAHVVQRALQRNLDERFASATQMGDALLDIIDDRDVQYATQALAQDAVTLETAPHVRDVKAALKVSPAAERVDETSLHAVPYHQDAPMQERTAEAPSPASSEEKPAVRPDALTAQMPMLPPSVFAPTEEAAAGPPAAPPRDRANARTETVAVAQIPALHPDTTAAGAPISDEAHTALTPIRVASDASDVSETADAAGIVSAHASIDAGAAAGDDDATRGSPQRTAASDRAAPSVAAAPPGEHNKPAPRMPAVPDLFSSSGLTDSGVRTIGERTAQSAAQPLGDLLVRLPDDAEIDPDAATRARAIDDTHRVPPPERNVPPPSGKAPASTSRRSMSLFIAGAAALPVVALVVFLAWPEGARQADLPPAFLTTTDSGPATDAPLRPDAGDVPLPAVRLRRAGDEPVARAPAPHTEPASTEAPTKTPRQAPAEEAPPTTTRPQKVDPPPPKKVEPPKPAPPPVPVRLRVAPTRGVLWGADGRVLAVKSGRVRVLSNIAHLTAYREATGSYHEVPVKNGAAQLNKLSMRRVRFVTDKAGATVRYHKTGGLVGTLPFAAKPFTIGRYAFVLTFKDGSKSQTGQVEIVAGDGVQVITALSAP